MATSVSTFTSAKALANIEKLCALLKERGGGTPRDLANATGMARQNVSAYLKHMQKLGLVVCTEEAVCRRMGGSTGSYWEVVAVKPVADDEPERDEYPRKVIVRKEWEPYHARSRLDCHLFGTPKILEESHA